MSALRVASTRQATRRVKHMAVGTLDPHRFASVVSPEDYAALLDLISSASHELQGRVVWNVNSTYKGGGVAELLQGLVGYARGAEIDARWVVIRGDPAFFEITKGLHNRLHGFDQGPALGEPERLTYERTLGENAAELVPLLRSRDVVILHDPQTAGLVDAVKATGATVIWRCHIGMDHANRCAREAWTALRPYVLAADVCVFSREAFAWDGLDPRRIAVIQPSIDAFSAKNQPLTRHESLAILARAGIVTDHTRGRGIFTRGDGTPARVDRRAELIEAEPLTPADPLLVQISRWDRLKDPLGVMRAFAEHIAGRSDVHLVLAGPAADAVSDDPEGAAVFAEVQQAWDTLPQRVRRRIHLASLPMEDVEENAAIVNALQRHADVLAQKSLAEGFGLTVAEAMWKQRPVVASRIGGIQDQIVDGESGLLVSDPLDLAEFGAAVVALFSDRERAGRIGVAAHARVRNHFLAPHHLGRYFELIHQLDAARGEEAQILLQREESQQ